MVPPARFLPLPQATPSWCFRHCSSRWPLPRPPLFPPCASAEHPQGWHRIPRSHLGTYRPWDEPRPPWWLRRWLLGNGLQRHQHLVQWRRGGKSDSGDVCAPQGWIRTPQQRCGMARNGCRDVWGGMCSHCASRKVLKRGSEVVLVLQSSLGTTAPDCHCCPPVGRRNPVVWGLTLTHHPVLGSPFPTDILCVEILPTAILLLGSYATEPGVRGDLGDPRWSPTPPSPPPLGPLQMGPGDHGACSPSHLGK